MKKRLILAALPLFSAMTLTAQEPKVIPSKAVEATVYFRGAEVVHTARTNLARGENVLSIEGLSPSIDVGSLKIRTTGGAMVSSYEFSIDHLSSAKAVGPELQKLKDSIAIYQAERETIDIAYSINGNMLGYLRSGTEKNVSGSEQGLGIDELVKTIEYYRSKALELESEQARLDKRRSQVDVSIARLEAQLNQESVKGNKTSGVLRLTLSAPAAAATDFTISYFTPAASWSPYYDVLIGSTDRPVTFALKSGVRQTTGLDWERVKLTLSTATPTGGKVAPLFSTWFLRPVQPQIRIRGSAPMQNAYSYEAMDMDEAVVVGYGSQKRAGVTGAVPQAAPEPILTMDDYVTASENELNLVYAIDLPYSIPGNGKVQNIDLQTRQADAEYQYYSAPKLDSETYLLAEIAEWQSLGLLSAPAKVTYDGTYIGETRLDAASTQAKLTLTLGTDRRVAVKRERLQDFSTTRTLGSNTEQVVTYQITVKNNQNRPVRMVTKEQYPTSTDGDITVSLDTRQTTPWTARVEDTGVLTWEEELAAGETKTYRISYTVRYPKDMNLNL